MSAVALAIPPVSRALQGKRLVGDRFRRIWQVVEEIAAQPGLTRADLARRFHLSERQVQADLNIIRDDMRLPLVRRGGYRFVAEGPSSVPLTLREAQLLVLVLGRALGGGSVPKERLRIALRKMPYAVAPHLQPLVERTVDAVCDRGTGQHFLALADALLAGHWVRLDYPPHESPITVDAPIVRPELLVPYLGGWFVVGELYGRPRTVMLPLDAVRAVTLAGLSPNGGGR